MQAEIISIGTELLLGRIVNTNAAYLGQKLAALGIDLFYQTTVGDNSTRLFTVLKRAMRRSDVIITTGGLGPTVDDITLENIARATEKKLILELPILQDIKEHFQRRHILMPKANMRQALVPQGARWLKNEAGTAPGLIIPFNKKVFIALPGPPQELSPMVERDVLPYLVRHFSKGWIILGRTIKTCGLAESQVNQKVNHILKLKPPVTVGIYAHTEGVDLNITAKAKNKQQAQKLILPVERKIRARLKNYIYAYDAQTMEEIIAQLLKQKKKTIAVAESCTGGLIAQRLTNISGSSQYFPVGIVAYSNETKQSLLGIPQEILNKYGAVSKETAKLLAGNIRQLAKADLGLGVTGIAGPGGATAEKPLGLVYIALATPRKLFCETFHFHCQRNAVRLMASQAALDIVRRYLS